jgi:hypothetical protein
VQLSWRIAVLIACVTAARVALLAAELVPLYGDEAQYWSWSLDPSWGYFSKPPMVAWLISLTTWVAGSGELGVKLASPLAHAMTSALIFVLGARLYCPRIGFWSAAVFLTMPAVSFSSALISTDPPLLMFFAAGVVCFVLALDAGRSPWWIGVGVAVGLAMLTKYTAVVFPLSALLYLGLSRRHRRLLLTPGPYGATLIAVAVLAPNILWNARTGFVTMRHVGENADVSGLVLHPLLTVEFLGSQLGVFGPVLFAVLMALLLRWRRSTQDDRQLLLLSFVAPLLVVMTAQSLLSGANANWAAPIYVTAPVAVVAVLMNRRRWLVGSVIAHLVFAAALYAYEPVRLVVGAQVPAQWDVLARLREWPRLGDEVAALHSRHPGTLILFEYRMVLAECLYYGGLRLDQVASWNPDGHVDHHYDLVTDIDRGDDALLVSRWPKLGEVQPYFQSVEKLPELSIRTHPDRVRTFFVYRLRGFRGYDAQP